MKPEASSTRGGPKVRRDYELCRLAGDCQARAYEQLLPVRDLAEIGLATRNQGDGDRLEINSLTEEGVAA